MKPMIKLAFLIPVLTLCTEVFAQDPSNGNGNGNGSGNGGSNAGGPSVSCPELSEMRGNLAKLNGELATKLTEEVVKGQPEAGSGSCISKYSPELGLGIPGIMDGMFDNIGETACQALDDYVNDSLAGLGAAISGPMDLAGIEFGFGKGEGSFDITRNDIGIDMDGVFDRIRDEAPTIDNGYQDFDRTGGRDIGDYPLLDQSRGRPLQTPGFNPSSGGRR